MRVSLLPIVLSVVAGAQQCTPIVDNDIDGADYINKAASSAAVCCNLCSADSACGAAVFSGYNGGWCWMKFCGDDCKFLSKPGSGVTAFKVRDPTPLPVGPDPCNPPIAGPGEPDRDRLTAGTFNIQTQEATAWAPRICPARKVISALGFPIFLAVQEVDVQMMEDIVGYSGRQVYFTLNGEFDGTSKAYLPQLDANLAYCRLKSGPCNVWGTYDNCQGPGIQLNQGFMLLYRNSSYVKLLQGGRRQFTTQEGCPRSEVVRNYEFGLFQVGGMHKVVVYASHLAWPQAADSNKAQSEELYADMMANFDGVSSRPWYIGQGGNFQLDVKGLPFILIGDLNSFAADGRWNKPNINLDVNSQWDWVISQGLTKLSSRVVSAAGATDHANALSAEYNFPWQATRKDRIIFA